MITETIKIFRRPEIVTVARESADVIIYGFAYRIWIENTELLLEEIEEKVGEIYLNEQRILMERGSVTLKFQEGDSLLFEEGRITLFADQIRSRLKCRKSFTKLLCWNWKRRNYLLRVSHIISVLRE